MTVLDFHISIASIALVVLVIVVLAEAFKVAAIWLVAVFAVWLLLSALAAWWFCKMAGGE